MNGKQLHTVSISERTFRYQNGTGDNGFEGSKINKWNPQELVKYNPGIKKWEPGSGRVEAEGASSELHRGGDIGKEPELMVTTRFLFGWLGGVAYCENTEGKTNPLDVTREVLFGEAELEVCETYAVGRILLKLR